MTRRAVCSKPLKIRALPAHKNQHYVPRCLLKPFTQTGEGHAINVFNISRKRSILLAPVKSQCSRDYFYGREDLRGEKSLTALEGEFSKVLKKLMSGSPPDTIDKKWLQRFALVQWRRTVAVLEELRRYVASMEEAAFARRPDMKPAGISDEDLLAISMRTATNSLHYVEDMKVAIFQNLTDDEFVISDNPSVLTNRLHLQRWNQNNFGLSSSGAMLSMPLAPRLSLMLYDGRAYSANRSKTGFIELHRSEDVSALNEFQFFAANQNLYFSESVDPSTLATALEDATEQRSTATPDTTIMVPSGRPGRYRRALPGEEKTSKEMLLATSFRYPSPTRWASGLALREKVKTHSDGSAVGHVRKAEWLTRTGNFP